MLTLTASACATRSAVFTPGNDVTRPVLVSQVRPQYTQDALKAGIEGSVLLDCVVQADGTVGDVKVVRSLDSTHGLDAQAVQAAKQWTFQPGTRGGRPVAVRVPINPSCTLR